MTVCFCVGWERKKHKRGASKHKMKINTIKNCNSPDTHMNSLTVNIKGVSILHQKCLSDAEICLCTFPIQITGGNLSDHFCIISSPKPTIEHSYPLHIVIGQLCRGEKGAGVWTSLSSYLSSFLAQLFLPLLNVFQERLSENVGH